MYLDYFNLTATPFDLSPGPRFFWLGEKHTEALAALKNAILENRGFLLLTGDVGVGKTALIHRLLQDLDQSTVIANIPDPGLDTLDFFNILASEFHMARKFNSKGEFLIELKKFLRKTHAVQKNVLLIIDEAQRLNEEILEQVRLLSNIEMSDRKLINIFFVGQPEFSDLLMDPVNRAVRQRIIISFHFDSLTERDCGHYIRHRLKVAGAMRDIFSPDAIDEIYRFSRGCPRLINIVCDHALLCAYSAGVTTIGADVIEECEQDLRIPAGLRLKGAEDQPEPPAPYPVPALEPRRRRPKATPRLALVSLFCVLAVVAVYLLLNSRLRPAGFFAPRPPIAQEEPAIPAPGGTTAAEVGGGPPPVARPPVPEAAAVPAGRVPVGAETDLQRQPYDIVDQTMTISAEQNPSPADSKPPAGDQHDGSDSASDGRAGGAAGPQNTPDAELKPAPAPAGDNRGATAQLDPGESGSDRIRRLVAEIEAGQRRGAAANREKVLAPTSEKRIDPPMPGKKEPTPAGPTETGSKAVAIPSPKPPASPPAAPAAAVIQPAAPAPAAEPLLDRKTPAVLGQARGKDAGDTPAQPPAAAPAPNVRLEERLRSFLQSYCDAYAAKDLNRFDDFFGPGAQENGKPFDSLLPKYQKNFDSIDAIVYRIELQQYTYDSVNKTVRVEGDFLLKWLPADKKWRENAGKIFMDLKDDGRSFLVQNLDYYGSRGSN